jgi:hypothetical protein
MVQCRLVRPGPYHQCLAFLEQDSCLPWLPTTCSGESFPVDAVNATCKEDVKKGVDIARENNVRIVVKATGHDYIRR